MEKLSDESLETSSREPPLLHYQQAANFERDDSLPIYRSIGCMPSCDSFSKCDEPPATRCVSLFSFDGMLRGYSLPDDHDCDVAKSFVPRSASARSHIPAEITVELIGELFDIVLSYLSPYPGAFMYFSAKRFLRCCTVESESPNALHAYPCTNLFRQTYSSLWPSIVSGEGLQQLTLLVEREASQLFKTPS